MTPEEPIPHWPGELVTLDGGQQVYVRGTPDRATEQALFVHGLAGSSRNWTDLIDLLRPRLACDALGNSRSPRPVDGGAIPYVLGEHRVAAPSGGARRSAERR